MCKENIIRSQLSKNFKNLSFRPTAEISYIDVYYQINISIINSSTINLLMNLFLRLMIF